MSRKGLLFIYSALIFFIGILGVWAEDNNKIKNFALSVNSNKDIVIRIECEECDENTKFNIYRSLNSIDWVKIDVVDENTYIDLDTKPNFKYYYKVSEITDELLETEDEFPEIKSTSYAFSLPVIKVTSKSYNQLLISWNSVKGAEKYEVYRATSKSGSYTKIATTTTLNYTDGGRAFNKTYYYKVRALNTVNGAIKYSGYSAIVANKTFPATPVLNLVSKTYNTIGLSWAKVAGATGYEIQKYDTVSKAWKSLKIQTGVSYTDTKLTTGKTYDYRVRAYKTVGSKKIYGAYSTIGKVIPIPATPSVTTFSVRSNQIDLNWSKIDGATGYRIQKYFNDTMVSEEFIAAIKYVDNLVSFNNEYKYVVTAYRTVNNVKIYSNPKTIIKKATPTGGIITRYSTATNKITLEYGMYSNEEIDGFVINRYTTATDKETILDISYVDALAINFKLEDINLTPNKTYKYQVYTYKNIEGGPDKAYSDVKEYSFKTLPMAPTITVQNNSYTSLKINYNAVDGATGYEIYRATSEKGTYTKIATTTSLSYVDNSKIFNKKYYYKVRAYTVVNGTKLYSSYSTIKNLTVLAPAPTVKTSYTYNTATLSWAKVSGATGYEIQRYDTTSKTWKSLKVQTEVSYTNSSLATGKTYDYRVRSYRTVSGKKIYGPYTGVLKVTPIPLATSSFTSKSLKSTEIRLEWSKVSGATGYILVKKHNGNTQWTKTITDLSAVIYLDDEVLLNEIYTYEVTAYRTVGGIDIYGSTKSITKRATPLSPSIDAIATGKKIFLEFEYSSSEKVDGFVIKRSTTPSGELTTILDILSGNQSTYEYTDYDVITNTTYYYHVYSYKLLGEERVYSEVTTSSIKNIPHAPAFVYGQKTYNSLFFEFVRYSDDDVAGYEIYRSTAKTGTYTKIGTTTSDTFLATNLTFGTTYYFKVRAYTIVNNVKIYGEYQLLTYKVKIETANTFPETVYANDHFYDSSTIKFKSVNFKQLSVSGDYVTYEVKVSVDLNMMNQYSDGYFVIEFYGMNMNTYNPYYISKKTYNFRENKGGKFSKTYTFTIKVKKDVTIFYLY